MRGVPAGAASPPPSRRDFLWGVATSAYQTEGGYNGDNQPKTNWASAEIDNHVVPLGNAAEFWTRYPEDFATCRKMGLSAFRMGIEWSRVQPTLDNRRSAPPSIDYGALDHYANMLIECRNHGLEPIVTLHHFVHPAWLGLDPWLEPTVVDHFQRYVRTAVRHVNTVLASRQYKTVRYYITINEPNMLLFNTYLARQFPGNARGFNSAARAFCQLLRAHVHAYDTIHDIHSQEGWARPLVTFNNYCSDLYWADKLMLDFLAMRERQVSPTEALSYIHQKKAEFESAFLCANIPFQKNLSYWLGTAGKRISDWLCRLCFDTEAFQPLQDCIFQSRRERSFDYLALDYYDPFSAHVFRPPVWWDHEFANKSLNSWLINTVSSKWWDWRVLPRGLHFFCKHYAADYGDRPVLIAENGMALPRRTDNSAFRRRDRMSRSEFLQLHVDELVKIADDGIPLIGYLHWSLFDNYEWGTYTPRFGLFSLDYQKGTERIPVDHLGDCPSACYAELIKRFGGSSVDP